MSPKKVGLGGVSILYIYVCAISKAYHRFNNGTEEQINYISQFPLFDIQPIIQPPPNSCCSQASDMRISGGCCPQSPGITKDRRKFGGHNPQSQDFVTGNDGIAKKMMELSQNIA